MLPRNQRQEALSTAYIRAVAARCGLVCQASDVDLGIDLSLLDVGRRTGRVYAAGFQLDLQAKSTTLKQPAASHIVYDLPVKNYEDLRLADVGIPRLLVVLVLPEEEAQWMDQTDEYLLLRYGAYWLSLRGLGPTANRRTVRLVLPKKNLFTTDALDALMDKVRRREW